MNKDYEFPNVSKRDLIYPEGDLPAGLTSSHAISPIGYDPVTVGELSRRAYDILSPLQTKISMTNPHSKKRVEDMRKFYDRAKNIPAWQKTNRMAWLQQYNPEKYTLGGTNELNSETSSFKINKFFIKERGRLNKKLEKLVDN